MDNDNGQKIEIGRPLTATLAGLLVFLAITSIPPIIIASFTMENTLVWYPGLIKPPLTPPPWVFAPVWTVLYAMMAVSVWLVWKNDGFAGNRQGFILFGTQLVINFMWSFLFFGLSNIALGLLDLVVLDILVVLLIRRFRESDQTAGLLLVPYLGWIAFATYLNFGIWILN